MSRHRIGSLGKVITGRTPPSSMPECFGKAFPFITPSDMDGRKRIRDTERYLSDNGYSLLRSNILPANSIAVSCIGWQMGKSVLTDRTSFTNQQLNSIIPDQSVVDADYLYYVLSTKREELKRLGSVGTRTPILNKSAFCDIEVELPAVELQRRIASVLSAYDDLIENNTRRIKILDEIARLVYREWFLNFGFPGHKSVPMLNSAIGQIPQGWQISKLIDVVNFCKGRKPAETRSQAQKGDVPVILVEVMRGGTPEYANPDKLVTCEHQDTVMVMDGSGSCFVGTGHYGVVGSTLGRFRSTRNEHFPPSLLYRFLESKTSEFRLKNVGSAIPHANKDYILGSSVLLAPLNVALQFSEIQEPLNMQIQTLIRQNHLLRLTRDLLLPRLISGQLELR